MKSGIYGEMPEVKIGQITVSKMNEDEKDQRLWLYNEKGEGMETNGEALGKVVLDFFNENF